MDIEIALKPAMGIDGGGFWKNTIPGGFRGNYPLYMGVIRP